MQETVEKTPGVYIRSNQHPPNELDMLWSGTRSYIKEERSPVLFFIFGLVVGVALSSAVFFLMVNKPAFKLGEALQSVIQEKTTLFQSSSENPDATAEQGSEQSAAGQKAAESPPAGSYTVQSGDTLGGIALKVYGDSSPAAIERIQRANKMANPNALSLGQTLVIPPKNY